MGRKAGIVLSALGFIFTLASLMGFVSMIMPTRAGVSVSGGGIGAIALVGLALAIGLIIIGFIWLIGIILYLASFLTTRYVESKATGTLQVLGGILHLIFMALAASRIITAGLSGPLAENLTIWVTMVLIPLIVGVLMIRGGVRRIRGWGPAYRPQYSW